jgi:hypothetical protein
MAYQMRLLAPQALGSMPASPSLRCRFARPSGADEPLEVIESPPARAPPEARRGVLRGRDLRGHGAPVLEDVRRGPGLACGPSGAGGPRWSTCPAASIRRKARCVRRPRPPGPAPRRPAPWFSWSRRCFCSTPLSATTQLRAARGERRRPARGGACAGLALLAQLRRAFRPWSASGTGPVGGRTVAHRHRARRQRPAVLVLTSPRPPSIRRPSARSWPGSRRPGARDHPDLAQWLPAERADRGPARAPGWRERPAGELPRPGPSRPVRTPEEARGEVGGPRSLLSHAVRPRGCPSIVVRHRRTRVWHVVMKGGWV